MSQKSPKLPSASQYQFSVNPSVNIPRCSIIRPFTHKTTINAGYLYPLYCEEVLPGDTFNVDASVVARLTTPIVPFMDNLYMDWHFFFVPYRLVWNHWEEMHGQQDNPTDTIDYSVPCLKASTGFAVGSIFDYFGLPTGVKYKDGDISALPFRAYNLIWNEWYRDENLQNSVDVRRATDTFDYVTSFNLLKRNKRKDYFTSALPWPQKGGTVQFSLAGEIPVYGNGMAVGLTTGSNSFGGLGNNSSLGLGYLGSSAPNNYYGADVGQTGGVLAPLSNNSMTAVGVTPDGDKSGLVANLSNVSAFSINELRSAFQIQRLLERNARGGTRYTELLQAHFGVTNPDARLQRPELLGSFTLPVSVNSVPQTSATGSTGSPQGNLSAFALASGMKHAFDKSFTEYGVVIGLCSIRADLTYQQGLDRMWSRRTRFDFYYPALAHLGEQAILNKEIYYQDPTTVLDNDGKPVNDAAFGYQERWSEYKYSVNRITGQLRSTYAQSLDYWHLAQKFDSLPTLSSSFVQENPPVGRILALTNAPQFVVDCYFRQNCVRPLPLFSVPGLIDHF